jgi:organic hydroperoxide reductase OsmC/OhrA
MKAVNLVRWCGVAAGVVGVVYIVLVLQSPELFTSGAFVPEPLIDALLLIVLLGQVVGMAGVHVVQRSSGDRLGRISSIIALVGFACLLLLIAAAMTLHNLPVVLTMLLILIGCFAPFVGLVLLGVAILRSQVFPRWVGALFIVGLPAVVVIGIALGSSLFGVIVLGIFWLLVGYALLSSAGVQSQTATKEGWLEEVPRHGKGPWSLSFAGALALHVCTTVIRVGLDYEQTAEKSTEWMADVTYVSHVKLEPAEGKVRWAYIPAEGEPIPFGVHSEVAEHYGVSADEEEPHATTLDSLVAAAGGWLLGTFKGALAARQVSFEEDSLYADTIGEVETENKVLVLKRIKHTLHLSAEEKDRETIERVVEVYEDSCPVARSIKPAIEITSELDLTTK